MDRRMTIKYIVIEVNYDSYGDGDKWVDIEHVGGYFYDDIKKAEQVRETCLNKWKRPPQTIQVIQVLVD